VIRFSPGRGREFTMDNTYLAYVSVYGDRFRILRADIAEVTIEAAIRPGFQQLTITGSTESHACDVPAGIADQTAAWILGHREGDVPAGPPAGLPGAKFVAAVLVVLAVVAVMVGRRLVGFG
jgi:hypothetical protein